MMKIFHTATVLLLVLGTASAEIPKPQIFIGVSNSKGLGNFDDGGLGGLEPALKWKTSGSTPSYDWEGGMDMLMQDVNTVPYSAWGKLKKTVKGYTYSIRGDATSKNPETVAVDVRVDGPTTSVQLVGTAGDATFTTRGVNIRTSIEAPKGKVTLSPRYNVGNKKADIGVSYAVAGTSVSIDSASKKVTLAQVVGGKTLVIPSITPNGDLDVTVQRNFEGFGRVTAAIKPNSAVNVKWEDGPWVANMNAPMNGFKFDGVDVSFKRKVDL